MNLEAIIGKIRTRHRLKDSDKVAVITTKMELGTVPNDPHKFTARITTDALDRQDEVVLPAGGQFGEFLNSGAIFWNHDYETPVGYPDKAKHIIQGENYVEAGGIFMKRPADWQGEWFPDFVREFVNQGISAGINPGVSIGFIPLETRRPTKLDVQRYGERVTLVHSKWRLLEFSIAPVQANQEAVVTAVGKGLIKREVATRCGIPLPPVSLPPLPKTRRVVIVLPKAAPQVDIAGIVQDQVRRKVYKAFGRLYLR